jgi:hypothetical protein
MGMGFSLFLFFGVTVSKASVVGISTHSFSEEARVLSLETRGFLSQVHEIGLGAWSTQGLKGGELLDFMARGGQLAATSFP